tara:strand:+ start:82 stop:999 length:918 start_codon:yes stop_codon:yes gene_type:complete
MKIFRSAIRRYRRYKSGGKHFTHSEEYRSDSENGDYSAAVTKALKNQKSFDNFKRSVNYQAILEHVSYNQGNDYLKILIKRDDGFLKEGLNTVLVQDDVGNPIKHLYSGIDILLSPTTLRYLKVASDLRGLFGKDLGEVAEIGCGYGGQAFVNDQMLEVQMSILFDLPVVNGLIDRYLDSLLLRGAYRTRVINKVQPKKYDLVISNYAFSELPEKLQVAYIKKIIAKSCKGYLTMNSGLGGPHSSGKLSLKQLKTYLPEFEIFEETPVTSTHNYIIMWGHNCDFASEWFKPKKDMHNQLEQVLPK